MAGDLGGTHSIAIATAVACFMAMVRTYFTSELLQKARVEGTVQVNPIRGSTPQVAESYIGVLMLASSR